MASSSWYKVFVYCRNTVAQVRSVLIVMMNITFNLNVAARFFIVIYAHDFVKNSQLDLKLFRQIYWLAWMVDLGEKSEN